MNIDFEKQPSEDPSTTPQVKSIMRCVVGAFLLAALLVFAPWSWIGDVLTMGVNTFVGMMALVTLGMVHVAHQAPQAVWFVLLFGFFCSLCLCFKNVRHTGKVASFFAIACFLLFTSGNQDRLRFDVAQPKNGSLKAWVVDDAQADQQDLREGYNRHIALHGYVERFVTQRTCQAQVALLLHEVQHTNVRLQINGQPATSTAQCRGVNRLRWTKATK